MQVDLKQEANNRDLDYALKELKRKIKKEGLMDDLRKHEFFVKPSRKRRNKKLDARKRARQEEREHERNRFKRIDSRNNW